MSDHRGFFLDINAIKLFGSNTQRLPSPEFRDIQSKHSKLVTTTYITDKHVYLSDCRFFDRLEWMCDSNVPNPHLAQELDCKLLTRAGISADKKCHKLRKPQWSVKLTKHSTKWVSWREWSVWADSTRTFIIRYKGGSVVGYTSAFKVAVAGSIPVSPTCPFFGQAVLSKESATPRGNRRLLPVSIAQFIFLVPSCMRAEVGVWLDTLSQPRSIQPRQPVTNTAWSCPVAAV